MRDVIIALLGATALSVASAPAALAADIPVKAPMMVAAYNWTGFYGGGNVGYGFSSNTTNAFGVDPGGVFRAVFLSPALSEMRNGIIGGLQFGVNFQNGNIVYGLEADIDRGRIKGSASGPPIVNGGAFLVTSSETKLDWFGTVRGRLGVTALDRSLFYATGGLAYGQVTSSLNVTHFNNGACTLLANLCLDGSVKKGMVGWTLGAGWEYAIAEKWSTKIEYLYYDLGTIDNNRLVPLSGIGSITFGNSTRINGNIVRVGLNYKLGGI